MAPLFDAFELVEALDASPKTMLDIFELIEVLSFVGPFLPISISSVMSIGAFSNSFELAETLEESLELVDAFLKLVEAFLELAEALADEITADSSSVTTSRSGELTEELMDGDFGGVLDPNIREDILELMDVLTSGATSSVS